MIPDPRWAILPLLVVGLPKQAPSFTYAGVGLASDLASVAARYPHSTPQGDYIRLEPTDIRDHVSAIEVSGTGPSRRVRVGFETQDSSGRPDYPRCRAIEAGLVARFGRPRDIRRFSEEASPRADRVWRSATEELTLVCFREAGAWWAEAVQIARR
jgi:hypothetical protein